MLCTESDDKQKKKEDDSTLKIFLYREESTQNVFEKSKRVFFYEIKLMAFHS
jgi:hypothetical protein